MRRAGVALGGVALAIGLVVLLPARPAAACSCAMPEPVTEATLAEYDVAFTGEIRSNEVDRSLGRRTFSVAVAEVFKGEAEAGTRVVTPATDAACGTDATVGTEVLFLMTRGPTFRGDRFADDDELVVISCGGHRSVDQAAALGDGRPPDPVETPDDDLLGVPGWFPVAVLFGFAAIAGTILVCVLALIGRAVRGRAGDGDPA